MAKHLLEGLTLGRVDLADAHLAGGHGAGLVEHDGVDRRVDSRIWGP
jgi:hypothetical protein